jgi:VanZ family protein
MGRMSILRSLFRWVPALMLMSVIFYLSSLPSSDIPDFGWLDMVVKKGGHAGGFGALALAFAYGLGDDLPRRRRFTIAWSLSVAYALTDEFHQSFVLTRNASALDVLIDSVGAATSLLLVFRYYSNSSSSSAS